MYAVGFVSFILTAVISFFGQAAEAVEGPLRLTPTGATSLVRIEAEFPKRQDVCAARQPRNLHAAYPGVLEVGRGQDGKLYLVTELTFDRYLLGIAEVPRSWPLEALKAQVVAARTYAFSHMDPSTALAKKIGFNICATDACQVYRGAGVEFGAWGEQWARAVSETDGQILEHGGKPASTFFFSTSNGKTYTNTEVFGGTALPYLKPVQEQDDQASPLSSWEVKMSLADLAEILRMAGDWTDGAISSVSAEGEIVNIKGPAAERSMSIKDLRRKLNTFSSCLSPKRYPTKGPDGKAYPQTIPSLWMSVAQDSSGVTFKGRGWGHGVGMVQWGLKGKADKGMGYADMLAFYYGGLRPVARPEPDKIRVLLATGIERIRIERQGNVSSNIEVPDGPIAVSGGADLSIGATDPIKPVLTLNKVAVGPRAAPGEPASVEFELSSPAKITVITKAPDGALQRSLAVPMDRGAGKLAWDGAAEAPRDGAYTLAIEADDGVDQVEVAGFAVVVVKPTPSPTATVSPAKPVAQPRPDKSPRLIYLGIAALVAVMIAGLVVWKKARGET